MAWARKKWIFCDEIWNKRTFWKKLLGNHEGWFTLDRFIFVIRDFQTRKCYLNMECVSNTIIMTRSTLELTLRNSLCNRKCTSISDSVKQTNSKNSNLPTDQLIAIYWFSTEFIAENSKQIFIIKCVWSEWSSLRSWSDWSGHRGATGKKKPNSVWWTTYIFRKLIQKSFH